MIGGTTKLLEIIRRMAAAVADSIAVCLPCVVVKYNLADQSVDLKLSCLEQIGANGDYMDSAVIISGVRVQFLQVSADCYISLPITAGTTGTLHICDCDISGWLTTGQIKKVDSLRRHDFDDSYFVAGLMPDKNIGQKISATNMTLQNKQMTVELYPDGGIKISGASAEVLAVLSDYMAQATQIIGLVVNDAHVVPVGGGSGVHSVATIAAWNTANKPQMEADKAKLDSMKR